LRDSAGITPDFAEIHVTPGAVGAPAILARLRRHPTRRGRLDDFARSPKRLDRFGRRADTAWVTPSDGARAAGLELAELLENARPIPLRDQVRLDKEAVYALVDAIDAAVRSGVGDRRLESDSGSDLLEAAGAAREAVLNAKPVPLTDQVRLRGAQAAGLAAALRRAVT
jgi:hypothetical protein